MTEHGYGTLWMLTSVSVALTVSNTSNLTFCIVCCGIALSYWLGCQASMAIGTRVFNQGMSEMHRRQKDELEARDAIITELTRILEERRNG